MGERGGVGAENGNVKFDRLFVDMMKVQNVVANDQ